MNAWMAIERYVRTADEAATGYDLQRVSTTSTLVSTMPLRTKTSLTTS